MNAFPTDAQENSIASGAWLYEVALINMRMIMIIMMMIITKVAKVTKVIKGELQGLASHQWADNLDPEEKERFRRKESLMLPFCQHI